MGAMKTPGVYIVEKSAFPNSVVEVATAVPAFIGYTEKADNKGKSLSNQPWRITSMAEFQNYFGFGPSVQFSLTEAATPPVAPPSISVGGKDYMLEQAQGKYLLYYSMMLFFQNGGGPCYIVSIGNYGDDVAMDKLTGGVDLLVKEQEPTIVVIPDAVLLKQADCISVEQYMLDHCGNVMKNRVAILDVSDGYRSRQDPAGDPVATFRNSLGINFLDFGMAYYPWLNTTITQAKDLAYWNLDSASQTLLQGMLEAELNIAAQPAAKAEQLKSIVDGIAKAAATPQDKAMLNKSLISLSPSYNMILTDMAAMLNLLPPAAAMAGVYTMVDNNRGVWKAPANVSLNAVTSPTVNITHGDQEDLNVTPQGKSINAIRPFVGEGTLVWGARTLDGNSLDWRYINVRRTMIMLEESIRLASKAYVFEPNVANTWVTIKSMVRNFLTGVWKKGGLAGAVPDDAFAVFCGLGETMTPEDILEGVLRVTVLVAISRPAEFIEITFQQQMQKS
ncbi:MAG: phage tail sheath C-terminal domain-containing protein [Gallionella sp.]